MKESLTKKEKKDGLFLQPQERGRERGTKRIASPLGDKGEDKDHRMTEAQGASLRGERSE